MSAEGYTGASADGGTTIGDVEGLTAALAAKAPLASPTFTGTVAGVTKTMVGLGSVDNTTDAAKPISTATQTALDDLDDRVTDLEEAPGGGTSAAVTHATVTSGNLDATVHASWTILAGLSVPVAAVVGDEVEFTVSALLDHNSARTDNYDLVVIVSSAIARFASTGTASPTGAGDGHPAISNSTVQFQGMQNLAFALTVEAGDLSGGNVTFGIAHKGAGGGKVFANATYPLNWRARNDH